jgi:hypothetical protein
MNSRHCATSSRVVPEILGVPMAKTGVLAVQRYEELREKQNKMIYFFSVSR